MTRRSVWAVISGAVVIVAVTGSLDRLLPPEPLLGTAYRVVVGVLGAGLTARLTPDRPLRHALILGSIGAVVGLVALVLTWNTDPGPRWYSVSHVLLAIPESWVGGKIVERG